MRKGDASKTSEALTKMTAAAIRVETEKGRGGSCKGRDPAVKYVWRTGPGLVSGLGCRVSRTKSARRSSWGSGLRANKGSAVKADLSLMHVFGGSES